MPPAVSACVHCMRRLLYTLHACGSVLSCIELCQVRDLEAELDLEQRRGRDAANESKKLQKQLADLRAQADDDHRTVAELNDQVTTLETRIITLKRQLEENVRVLYTRAVGPLNVFL